MLTYKKIDQKGDVIIYQYKPEGNGKAGIVSINSVTMETDIISVSADDIGTRYALKLLHNLSEMVRKKQIAEEGIVAWY